MFSFANADRKLYGIKGPYLKHTPTLLGTANILRGTLHIVV